MQNSSIIQCSGEKKWAAAAADKSRSFLRVCVDCVTQTACDLDKRQSLNQHTHSCIENENNLYLKN